MVRGSCCCGGIAVELSAAPTMMATCHCRRCRKVGAATFVFVKQGTLTLTAGRDLVATYPATPPYRYNRQFCRVCGTALGEILSANASFPVNAQLFDDDPGVRNRFHEFVAEKPAWYTICDTAKQFEGHPTPV